MTTITIDVTEAADTARVMTSEVRTTEAIAKKPKTTRLIGRQGPPPWR